MPTMIRPIVGRSPAGHDAQPEAVFVDRGPDLGQRNITPPTYRHAIAYRRVFVGDPSYWTQRAYGPGWVFDVNNHERDGATCWLPSSTWRNCVLLGLIPPRGTEQVTADWMAQVQRVESTGA